MAPSHSELGMAVEVGKDEVVITGLSGRLPESDNIMEFRQHLIDNEDMVTENDRRWDVGELLLPLLHLLLHLHLNLHLYLSSPATPLT